ncbi:transketolase family protein [Trabulsiella odontotermitis]|nr:transketolase [Trabulsiella odontotermitis]
MSSRKELANAIRALSMDAVQKAKSGHPGAPMGMADIAEVLWRDFLNHNPQNPSWADRDRFVLSNGHGSMLIYSLLHLTGYDLPMEELKNFRQLHSKTPGHPEVGYTAGVETTTGPLGQGIANAVGMAIAEKTLAAQFNRPGHDIVDHFTYAFMGDGCMMEGISHEVCSLAGTLKLGKLVAFYDDNGISIDGHVEGWFTDDTAKRFEAYGWHVVRGVDGHDAASIRRAVEEARAVTDKPSLLMCKTIIGFGSPNKAGTAVTDKPSLLMCKTIIGFGSPNKAGTHDSHGAPLGDAEVAATREQLGWKYAPFDIPSEIYAQWDAKEAGQAKESAWNDKFAAWAKAFPQEAAEFTRRMKGDMPADFAAKAQAWIENLQANPAKMEVAATREQLGWKYAPFEIPSEIYAQWDAKEAGQAKESAWNDKFAAYAKAFPQEAAEFTRRMKGDMPADFAAKAQAWIENLQANPAKIASRKASQNAIEAFGPWLPEFLGGSADLAPSNLTLWSGSKAINEDAAGNYIHYGVREFGMTAIANGIALHGGFLPYTSTFLMFVEYARNAVRMAALMKQRQVMVYTHDSIGLGEDGPTHQPVEQMASLRVTPNMSLWRPCDQVESAVAWKYGVERHDGPTALILSRQNLAQQTRTAQQLADIARGGYVLKDCAGQPELIFIATGSEVELAVAAWEKLSAEGVKARVVSMPSTDAFDKQDAAYRESVLPKAVSARVAVEAGIADYWYKYTGLNGAIVGMTTFGESAPAEKLFEEFGFTVGNVVAKAKALLATPLHQQGR